MTNPDNIVRVRARNGGRASVYEANGWGQAYSSGLLEGNGVVQNTVADMNVLVGGSTTKPDVVLAENPAGYRIALDLVGQQPIAITAPATNSRISAIVAYTDDLSLESTEDTVTGSPASCGLIVVNGTAGAEPSEPTDSQIRTAITADGATGSQAAYCVIATIEVASDTTIITDSLINIKQAAIPSSKLDFTSCGMHIYYAPIGTEISFVAEADMYVEVEALTGYVWGYGGGTMSLDVSVHTGLERIMHRAGGLTGGDQIGRQVSLHALYKTTKDTQCTLKVTRGGAAGGGQSGTDITIVKCYKLVEYN